MDPQAPQPPSSETIPKGLEEIVYAAVEKAIQTLLIDQGYLLGRQRNRSRSHSRSRSRSHSRGPKHHHGKSRSHSRGRKHHHHGKSVSGSKDQSDLPLHFHHHHHFGISPGGEVEGRRPRHGRWGKKPHGRGFPFAVWGKRCHRGDGGRKGGCEEGVAEIVDLVEGSETAEGEGDLEAGMEGMKVDDGVAVTGDSR